ncbi:SpoU rRNA Methylase family [Musa troglodytarum]|uniref:SpoU rRNA Methylase family n=1 Tax=Musa troglodytarum TaxID=320322 RepID=A0A9E7HFX7_9LILI|nr:SpoU rRNA Methylase family [Musa troglodytarum]
MDAGEAVTLWASVESLVVVHNVAKRHNVGTMARSATAFGVSEIVLVGRRDFNAFGSHGSTSHLRFRHFHSLSQARHYLKGTGLSAKECEICDFFVYIPQYGCGTASLNVTVAASIVLHHFGGVTNSVKGLHFQS